LIILKPSVQLLSRPLSDWFSLSRFREIERFISLIFIMPSSMVFLLKRSTWNNLQVLLTLLFHLMCVDCTNHCMVWNRHREHGTLV
jgi:hypothetical protein